MIYYYKTDKEKIRMEVFLQPAGEIAKEQLEITIKQKVKLTRLKKYITQEKYYELEKIYPNKELNMWGVTVNKQKVWEQMQVGDFVLFYGNKRFFAKGRIQYKIHHEDLARNIWGTDKKGLCWEHIFFLDDVQIIDIPLEEFNQVTGYQFKHVQGAMRVKQEYAEKILKEYENIEYIEYQEKQSKIRSLKEKIWELDIENKSDKVKISSLKTKKKSNHTEKKVTKRKNKKDKNNLIESLSEEDKYHLGVQGELYIYKLLREKNESLLKELKIEKQEIKITCYNKDYQKQENWQDQSINKGHDILIEVKGREEPIFLEIKTSVENTMFFSMTGNEVKVAREKRENYYIIKIVNFIDADKMKIYCISNPNQLAENEENIKEFSFYL